MDSLIRLVVNEGVASLTVCRSQKRNALTRELLQQVDVHLRQLAQDSRIRLFVLAAEGPVFCAGMDLVEMRARAESSIASQEYEEDARQYAAVVEGLFTLACPTLAVVQGPAVAGGVGLVLACDLVLCSEAASFTLPEPMRGIVAAMVTPLLQYRVGAGVATYLLLSGATMGAQLARQWGLCHDVVPAEELRQHVEKWRASILRGAPSALALTKSFLRECYVPNLRELLQRALTISAQAREGDAAREGLAAFLEQRQPVWQRVEPTK